MYESISINDELTNKIKVLTQELESCKCYIIELESKLKEYLDDK